MRRNVLAFMLSFVIATMCTAWAMQETIRLTVPVSPPVLTLSTYQLGSVLIQKLPKPLVQIALAGSDGTLKYVQYPCAAGCLYDTEAKVLTLIQLLNTADFRTNSLLNRVNTFIIRDFPTEFPGGATIQ